MRLHVINHSVFLDSQQRKDLAARKLAEVVGASVPVKVNEDGSSDGPAREIFCQYIISSYPVQSNAIIANKEGYIINIGEEELVVSLQDVKNGGCGEACFSLAVERKCEGEEDVQILHQVRIADVSKLEGSLEFLKLD